MTRRLEELELKKMHEVQAVAETPVQVKLCPICQSYEHLVEECPTIPAEREMFGDQANVLDNSSPITMHRMEILTTQVGGIIQISHGRPRAPQYQQPAASQPSQQSSSLEQAIVNLSKVVGDFVGDQKAINAQLSQRIDSVERLCTIKRGLNVNKKAFLTEQVSAIIQCKSPLKYKDPGCPTISVMIGGKVVEKALLDLGASVNLLPYSVYKQLGLGELKPTSITLSLADRSVKIPRGHQEKCLLEVLKRCKKAIGWQISDLKGISPLVCTHHIYMEEEAKPIRQPQRRLNPHLQEVVRAEVLKLLQAGIIYPYLTALGKDHFPLPFIDQVLERVSGHPFYCFLDGYSGYFQIEIDVEDQEKTTFTCPFGTYAYRRMPFGLCNAPATFQRCMLSIFSDMVERIMEVFMDDITVYGGTFEECLVNLEAVLNRCIEKDLVLNWEKCHFMVRQGIVLGHIISEKGIEVDKAKVELIVKLPSPTTVKGVRQFLGHAGFYRRFIKDFSNLSKPLLRAPNWQLPFEVMCDASDFAIGAVLGQREDGKPYVIYYASKTLNEAQRNYTTTEKELLAVVFALDKFRAYLKTPWYAHIANYLVTGEVPSEWNAQDRKHFFAKFMLIIGKSPFLFKYCADQIIRKCVPEEEQQGILSHCHEMHVEATLPLRKQP
ncbi:Retrovirus-related Pol polyprotein from transposon 17.6 [Vitis vinifera]|uniref:Retrovirus-related Pol polyprotein from transposon 17.6 n=1 Tax=Vitis vinifera TaxID=29760 RepID=A0A438HK79_VITVI|nr:Retrovirus-related Pol polyprotein from transposon 17.6 [Vitis vinifera]